MTDSRVAANSTAPPRTGLILVATCLASIVVMATTASGAALLPEIARALQTSQTEIQWIGDCFPLVLASLLLPAGNVLDRYGRKRGMVGGLVVLTLGLAWSGAADTPGMLIAARCLAGVGAAFVFPATLATISAVIPPARRGSAVGLWAGTATIGGLVGLLLAGGLAEIAWWGSVFWAMAGLSAVCLAAAAWVVPETSDPEHAHLDPLGTVLSILAIGGLVLGVTEGPVHGWTDPLVVGAFAAGAAGAAGFVAWELRCPRPLLDLRLFRNPSLATSSAALFLTFFAVYGWFFLAFQYHVFVLGYGPFGSALGFVPAGLTILVVAPFAPTLARRYGRRLVIAGGVAICALGAALMAAVGGSASYGPLVVAFLVFSVGFSFACIPPTEAVLEALPPAQQGVASAINDTARELGAAVGIAIIGSAFNAAYRGDVGAALASVPEPLAEAIRSSPAAGFGALGAAGAAAPLELFGVIRDGVIAGWQAAFILAAVILTACTVYVAVCFPGRRSLTSDPTLAPGAVPVPASDPPRRLESAS